MSEFDRTEAEDVKCQRCNHAKVFHDGSDVLACTHGACTDAYNKPSGCLSFWPPEPSLEQQVETLRVQLLRLTDELGKVKTEVTLLIRSVGNYRLDFVDLRDRTVERIFHLEVGAREHGWPIVGFATPAPPVKGKIERPPIVDVEALKDVHFTPGIGEVLCTACQRPAWNYRHLRDDTHTFQDPRAKP